MKSISNWTAFLDAAGSFITTAQPLEAMREAGLQPAGVVAEELDRARQPRPFPPDLFARLQQTYGPPPPTQVFVGRPPVDEPPLNTTGYALVASTDLGVLNAILAELWRVGTIPREFDDELTASLVTLAQLHVLCTGVPADAELGRFQISAPVASASSITPLNVHLQLSWALPLISATTSAVLLGELGLEIPLGFQVTSEADVRLSLGAIEGVSGAMQVGVFSTLQPRSEEARRTIETNFVDAARKLLFYLTYATGALSFSGSIPVQKKRFPNSTIDITQVSAVTVRQSGGDYVIVGINVENFHEVHPTRLRTQPLPEAPQNVHTVVDQSFASDALSAVITSGDLATFFNRVIDRHSLGLKLSDVAVKNGSVVFLDGRLRVSLDCVLVDACAFSKDLNFTATVSGVPTVQNGTLTIATSKVDFNLDNTDAVACAILGSFLGPFSIIVHVGVLAFVAAYNPSSSDLNIPVAETSEPLPGSDKVVDLELTRAKMSLGVLGADGRLQLISDPLRAYVYLRVTEGRIPRLSEPLRGAIVELYELDNPAPAGDDVAIPEVGFSETITPKFTTTREVTYEPRADQLLDTQTTDETGRVTFVVISNMVGGTRTETTIKTDNFTNEFVSTTKRRSVGEALPDLAVTIRAASGEIRTRRRLVGLNVIGKRLGRFDSPLEVRVPPSGVLDPVILGDGPG